jgi:hypothetical protein
MNKLNCDFSYKHYFDIIQHAKKKFKIGPVNEFESLKQAEKFMILRHDVDYSLEKALNFAKKEKEMKIQSTYFILLEGIYYNALSIENTKIIKKISDLGHEVGLHYDSNNIKSKTFLEVRIKKLLDVLENIIGKKIVSIAQHNVSISLGVNARDNSEYYDAMNKDLLNNTNYFSDSVQNWRKGCVCRHIDEYDNLYVLTHPIWWSERSDSREQILQRFEKDNMHKTIMRHKKTKNDLHNYLQNIKNEIIK